MRAILEPGLLEENDHAEAQAILRACVHCGFCNATCPSYQVQGDERDGPRGRIYLMKSLLEGMPTATTTRTHLDRCLGCRACETTCPSGVAYTRLLEMVRPLADLGAPRPMRERLLRRALRQGIPLRRLFGALLTIGRALRPVLPSRLRQLVPPRVVPMRSPAAVARPREQVLLFEGCVQQAAAPAINRAAEVIFARLGIASRPAPPGRCCGALALHLGANEEARREARRNVDAWYPLLHSGQATQVVCASSGCTQVMRDYGHLLRDEPAYASRAAFVAEHVRDPAECLAAEDVGGICGGGVRAMPLRFQAPCSLQHGLKGAQRVTTLLESAGFQVRQPRDAHLCCGSAGTYSILQPAIAGTLRARKLDALDALGQDVVVTANIGCQLFLQQATDVPVRHWLEVLAEVLPSQSPRT